MNHPGQGLDRGMEARPRYAYSGQPLTALCFPTRPVWQHANLRLYIVACFGAVAVGLLTAISPWTGFVVGLGAIILAVALVQPIILGYLIIAAIALLSGTERGRLVPLLEPNEVSLILSVYIVFLVAVARRRPRVRFSGYSIRAFTVLIGGTVFIPIVAYLLQDTRLTYSNAFKLLSPLQYFLLFWLFSTLPEGERDRRRLIRWMLACGSVVAIVGILQGLGVGFVIRILENWYASSHEAMAASAGRVTSLLGAWNSLGIFMMINILMGWAILPEIVRTGARTILIVIMALCAVCLVASGSYAGILGLMMGILLIEALARRRRRSVPILIATFAMIGIALIVFQPILQPLVDKRLAYQYQDGGIVPQTMLYRIMVWRQIFIPAIIEHFPWAVYPTVPSSYAWGYEESQYISLLFRTGLSGLLGHLAWVGITISWLYRTRRQSSGFTNMMITAALTIIILLSIAGLTNEVFSFAGSADYLWIMLALIANSKERG